MTLAALPPPLLAAFNHLLAQAPWARERLRPYAGRTARFTLPPLAGAFGIDPEGHVAAPPASCEVADVTIHLPAAAPLLALQGLDVLMRGVRLEGAVDFAESLGFVLKHLRWDAEEDLSRVVGDIAAHRIVGGAQQFVACCMAAGVVHQLELIQIQKHQRMPTVLTPEVLQHQIQAVLKLAAIRQTRECIVRGLP